VIRYAVVARIVVGPMQPLEHDESLVNRQTQENLGLVLPLLVANVLNTGSGKC